MENKLNFKEKINNLENLTNNNNRKEKDNLNKKIIIITNENVQNRIKIYEQNTNNLSNYTKLITDEELIKYFNYLLKLLNNNIIDLTCKNYLFN
jgi:hypothetical protein